VDNICTKTSADHGGCKNCKNFCSRVTFLQTRLQKRHPESESDPVSIRGQLNSRIQFQHGDGWEACVKGLEHAGNASSTSSPFVFPPDVDSSCKEFC